MHALEDTIFWNGVTSCSLAQLYRRFGGPAALIFRGDGGFTFILNGCVKRGMVGTSPPPALRPLMDPGLLQDQFPGVSILGYFSAAFNTHFLHIILINAQPFLSWFSKGSFSFWAILKKRV